MKKHKLLETINQWNLQCYNCKRIWAISEMVIHELHCPYCGAIGVIKSAHLMCTQGE